VFYTHLLSLPIFLFLFQDVKQGLASLSLARLDPYPSDDKAFGWGGPWLILLANLTTQLVCVSGVNRLSSRVSSVSTNIVLTTRKAISLCFSVWWFSGGSGWNKELALGAGMVFVGSLVFSVSPGPTSANSSDRAGGERKEKIE
jgi:UDP-xylose/UDP-N-acetylglucosamine transporter B4